MKHEYVIKKDNVRNLVKSLTLMEGKTLTQLKIAINHKYNKKDTLENLTNKLRLGTIKVSEFIEIFETLGYEIIVRKNV